MKEVGVVDADDGLVGLSGGVVTLHKSDTRRLVLVPLAVIKSGCRVQVLGRQPAACKSRHRKGQEEQERRSIGMGGCWTGTQN
jgi:hypothetical protein